MLKQWFDYNGAGLHHSVRVHISIVLLVLYQPLHLPPSYTSLPETVFTRCLSSLQSKYQRGEREMEGGVAMQILTCSGAQCECVKQIIHEMASELTVVCSFHLKCLDSALKGR